MEGQSPDTEIDAIKAILLAIDPLEEEARRRVLSYVAERLSIRLPVSSRLSLGGRVQREAADAVPQVDDLEFTDIRALKEAKLPGSAVEMAVVVAYYLSEKAPLSERKATVNTEDLRAYFKQAKFPLPRSLRDVLPNAKKSGYLANVSPGEYKLNSVGYNLAVHGLPRSKPQE